MRGTVVGVDHVAALGVLLVVQDVAGDALPGVERVAGAPLRVDATAVVQHRHVVEDEVVGDGVVVGEVRLRRLALLVRPAAPADRDRGVGQAVELVVRDRGALRVPDEDADAAVELHRQVEDVVVQDPVAAGAVGAGGERLVHRAELDAVAGDVGEHVALHQVVRAAVAEVEPGGAQVHEPVAREPHVARVGEAHVRRLLGPRAVRAGAAGRELTQPLHREPVGPGDRVAGLDLGEPLVAARAQPGGVRELQAVEGDVLHGRGRRALPDHELLQHRRGHACRGHVLAGM